MKRLLWFVLNDLLDLSYMFWILWPSLILFCQNINSLCFIKRSINECLISRLPSVFSGHLFFLHVTMITEKSSVGKIV